MADSVYCTASNVEALLSDDGVEARVDDAPEDIDDVIDDASSQIDEYLLQSYGVEQLLASRWVTHCCADLAAFLLCERRGNPVPSGIQAKWDRRMESLERIRLGQAQVSGIARRRVGAPKLSQPRVKLGPVPHTVIERRRGPLRNPPQDYRQRIDPTETPLDYRD